MGTKNFITASIKNYTQMLLCQIKHWSIGRPKITLFYLSSFSLSSLRFSLGFLWNEVHLRSGWPEHGIVTVPDGVRSKVAVCLFSFSVSPASHLFSHNGGIRSKISMAASDLKSKLLTASPRSLTLSFSISLYFSLLSIFLSVFGSGLGFVWIRESWFTCVNSIYLPIK